ncbi:monooxygenase [Purpureocillium lavendulum]|uniref:Monooxygenase n=1 Tax=Purpureocillium lavendulum TaxID=1247861 RepID=A0AB34FVW5_9HYPO|nr:monooxygenase [Purpureocillium lavendulum]
MLWGDEDEPRGFNIRARPHPAHDYETHATAGPPPREMAEPLPPALKIPEISRFINRANQLRAIKPAIAYWCTSSPRSRPPPDRLPPPSSSSSSSSSWPSRAAPFRCAQGREYHAVNQIVGKALHQADDDSFNFTRGLLERLEATKAERADDDAIVDNDAGQAYVEQFAQETFARAERTLRADKVTRQTADTFDAAATFFDLTREWAAPDAETLAKIKFAKWNAARILKAIREGRDPNESNPKQPAEEEAAAAGGDDEDEELRRLAAQDPEARELVGHQPHAATVEDVPDEAGAGSASAVPQQPSPPVPSPQVHEGYFPPPPPGASSQPSSAAPEPFVPSPMSASPSSATQIPPQPSPQIPTKLPSQFAPPPPAPQEPSAPPAWSNPPPVISAPVPAAAPAPVPAPVPAAVAPATTAIHHKDLDKAQKHAKWAISALNFEDVPTAVQELRNALAMLGVHGRSVIGVVHLGWLLVLVLVRPAALRPPADEVSGLSCDVEQAVHHGAALLDAGPGVKLNDGHVGQRVDDTAQELAAEPFVEALGPAEALEDAVAGVALDEDGQPAHVDAVLEPEGVVDDPALWRRVPTRPQAQLKRVDALSLAGLEAREQRALGLEVAAGVGGEEAEGARAVEEVGGFGADLAADAHEAEVLVDALVVVRREVEDVVGDGEEVLVDLDAQLRRQGQEGKGLRGDAAGTAEGCERRVEGERGDGELGHIIIKLDLGVAELAGVVVAEDAADAAWRV